MTSDTLLESYYEFAMDGDTLMHFISEVLNGQYGPAERQPILDFLDQLAWIILGNIETRFDESRSLEADPDAIRDQTESELNAVRTRVLQYFSP